MVAPFSHVLFWGEVQLGSAGGQQQPLLAWGMCADQASITGYPLWSQRPRVSVHLPQRGPQGHGARRRPGRARGPVPPESGTTLSAAQTRGAHLSQEGVPDGAIVRWVVILEERPCAGRGV